MSIKIPSGPPGAGLVEQATQATETEKGLGAGEAASSAGEADPLAQVAADLASGKIDGNQAVDRILAATVDEPMLAAAPESLRNEIAEALRHMIETDPQLRSLARGLGAEIDND